jgi:hypothetical protein
MVLFIGIVMFSLFLAQGLVSITKPTLFMPICSGGICPHITTTIAPHYSSSTTITPHFSSSTTTVAMALPPCNGFEVVAVQSPVHPSSAYGWCFFSTGGFLTVTGGTGPATTIDANVSYVNNGIFLFKGGLYPPTCNSIITNWLNPGTAGFSVNPNSILNMTVTAFGSNGVCGNSNAYASLSSK